MRFAKPSKDSKHDSPDEDEEGDDEQQNLPLGYRDVPKETPVSAVRLYIVVNQSFMRER